MIKKLHILVAILFQLFNIGSSNAQCYTAAYGLYPAGTFNPTCTGAFQDITNDGWAGEYSEVNLVAGTTYTFRSSITTDYITVDNNGAAPLVGVTGVSSANGITWTCTTTGTYRFYTHTNSACGSININRIRSISCSVVPVYNPCTTIPTLTCGVATSYSMAASAGAWNSYGSPFATPGQEKLFVFTPFTTGLHNFTVNASSGWVDLFWKAQSSGCNSSGWTYVNDIFGTETWGINLTAGVAYYIMLDDEDQSANTGSISVACPSAPPESPNSISPNVASINCAGQSATLTVNGNVGTTYWFLNSCGNSIASSVGSGNSIVVSPAVTSTYFARNYNGQWSSNCASATVNVNASPSQPLNPTSNSPQCASVTITRSGNPPAGVTWYWQGTNPNGTATNLGSGPTYTANSSGTYYLRALNSSGCWSAQSASINVLIDAVPATPGALSSNSPQCNSVTITRSGNPAAGITWYWQGTNPNGTLTNLGAGPTYTANASGTYYIRALNNNNCWSSNSASTSVTVFTTNTGMQSVVACDSFTWVNGITYTNSTNSPSVLLPNASVFGCDSTLVLNLTVHPTFNTADVVLSCDTYTWIDGITYNASTSIPSYMLTSQYGCDSLVNLNLTIGNSTGDTTAIGATSIGSYFFNGIEYTESGVYNQTLMDQYGCDSVVTLNLIIEPAGLASLDVPFRIYPNPSNDGVFFLDSPYEDYHISAFDALGKQVVLLRTDLGYKISSAKGLYFIEVKADRQTWVLKWECF